MKIADAVVQFVQKNSPQILLGLGIGGVIGGAVLVGVESRKIDPIIEEHKEALEDIHMASDTGVKPNKDTSIGEEYTDKDRRKDVAKTYAKTALRLGKLYAPSVLILSGSVFCILKSHGIMSDRNAGLTVAYTGLAQAFNEYRKNIVEKYGEEADTEARYFVKAKKDKKTGDVSYEMTEATKEIDHSRFFDAESNLWDKSVNLNLMKLHTAEVNLNRKLRYRRSHIVTLNEIYAELDLRPSDDGQILGYRWVQGVDPVDEEGVPTKIRFGIYKLANNGSRVLKGVEELRREGDPDNESVMLLDFPNLVPII